MTKSDYPNLKKLAHWTDTLLGVVIGLGKFALWAIVIVLMVTNLSV